MAPATLLLLLAVQAASPGPVVVASKPFGESYVLAEIFAQLLEARGVAVDRRPGLGATEIAFRALRSGATYAAMRLRSRDDDLAVLESPDLVPSLLELLQTTLRPA